jgi:hypothetical protein
VGRDHHHRLWLPRGADLAAEVLYADTVHGFDGAWRVRRDGLDAVLRSVRRRTRAKAGDESGRKKCRAAAQGSGDSRMTRLAGVLRRKSWIRVTLEMALFKTLALE